MLNRACESPFRLQITLRQSQKEQVQFEADLQVHVVRFIPEGRARSESQV